MPRPWRMLPLVFLLLSTQFQVQAQSTITKHLEPSSQDAKPCVSTDDAKEALRLGRSLGYSDDEIVQAYGTNPCATISYLRDEVQQRAQQPTSAEQSVKVGYVKCQAGDSKVSLWLAVGNLTEVASSKCGDKLEVLRYDSAVWMKVRTQSGTVGYIPTAAVADSPNPERPKYIDTPTTASVPASRTATNIAEPSHQSRGETGAPCDKVVSFALADASGVHPFMGTGNWIANWVHKNSKKYADICFSQSPMQARKNFLIVLSESARYFSGFDPVVRTNTSTSVSPVSGSGTVTDNYGGTWYYTYDGTVTTTTTTSTNEDVPYTINSKTIFANAYDEHGTLVSRRNHVYSTKSGGDAANSAGYNLGNALRAINARGRLLGSVVKDIEGKR